MSLADPAADPAAQGPAGPGAGPRPQLWTDQYVLTLLTTFSFFGSFFYLLSVLPDYVDEIGGSEWQVGLIVSGFAVVPLFMRPFVGRWADRGLRLRLMRIGLVSMVASLGLMVFSEDVLSLFALRVVQGLGLATVPTTAGSMIAEIAPLSRRGEGVGFFGMATSAAQMAFPAVGVLIANQWGFDAVFAIAAVTAGVTLTVTFAMREPATQALTDGERPTLIPPRALFPMAIFMTVTFSFAAASTFLPLLSKEHDLGNAGLYFLVAGAGSVIMRPLAGRASDRYGRMPVILPGLVFSALGMWTLAQAESQVVMLVAAALGGIGLGAAHTALFALALDRVPGTQRGGATAVFQLAWDLGGVLGGVTLGVIATALSLQLVYWASGWLIIAGIIALLLGRAAGWTRALTEPAEAVP